MQDEIGESFHGNLLKTVIEHWASESLFEKNDIQIRNNLAEKQKKYLPNIRVRLKWNMDSQLVDKGVVAGDINFIDEHGEDRVLNFHITSTGANIQ